jgi:hypothetical protein
MWPAVGAASTTLLTWFLTTCGGFAVAGWLIGWCGQHLIPEGQTRLPRSLFVTTLVGTGLVVGAMAGLHIAEAEAVLSMGDSLAAERPVVSSPFPDPSVGLSGGLVELRGAVGTEIHIIATGGFLPYVVGHVTFGQWYDPIVTTVAMVQAYRVAPAHVGPIGAQIANTWARARPALHAQVLRKMAGWMVVALVLFGSVVFSAFALIAVAWADMHRHLHLPPHSAVPPLRPRRRPPGDDPEAPEIVAAAVGADAGATASHEDGPPDGAATPLGARVRLRM